MGPSKVTGYVYIEELRVRGLGNRGDGEGYGPNVPDGIASMDLFFEAQSTSWESMAYLVLSGVPARLKRVSQELL